MRRALLLLIALSSGPTALPAPAPAIVRVGVFGLFHTVELTVSAGGSIVSLRGDRDGCVLRGDARARVDLADGALHVTCAGAAFTTKAVQAAGAGGEPGDFELSVPGRITRRFHGRLAVTAASGELVPVVAMDLETAVASVVGAEQIRSAPPEALKAQAVAARSFFAAGGPRHRGFDFCDTTHCQFLREPATGAHPAARATRETAGLVLAYRGAPIAAFYSASCGGHTRTLVEAGLDPGEGYPYFGVECALSARRDAPAERNGHGIGLCQEGAASMAAQHGASFAEILRHYYPETTLDPLRQ